MIEERVQIRVGGTQLAVPVYGDAATTRKAAEHVTQRLQAIEQRSPRIDTYAFALEAALSFAAEVLEESAVRTEETAETMKALDKIHDALRELTTEYQP